MTLDQYRKAFALASDRDVDLSREWNNLGWADGFGLPDFRPVVVTTRQVAALMRWQGSCLNGDWDSANLTEIRECGRQRFTIAD